MIMMNSNRPSMSRMGGKLLNICLRNLLTPRQKCVSTTKSTLSDLVTLKWLEPLIITTIASIIITPRVTPFTPDRWVITLFHPIHLQKIIFDTSSRGRGIIPTWS